MAVRILFFVILAIEIYFGIQHEGVFVKILKPLLMPILMIVAFQRDLKERNLYFALIFSLLGDVFLMFSGEQYFILGLASFLIAHIFYILLFRKQFTFNWAKVLPFIFCTSIYFAYLIPFINAPFIYAVLAYCIVITTMGIFAAGRITNKKSYALVLCGAILFIISDSLIAFDKFASPIPMNTLWVMGTYGVAQFLFVIGWKN